MLGLSVPVSVVGVGLFTSGSVTARMSSHAEVMRDLDKISENNRNT
ncbi:hypothetical protein ACFCXP_18080 [Streptomyces niveus]